MNDPIIDEVRRARESIVARLDYDFDRIAAWGREQVEAWASGKYGSPRPVADFSRKPDKAVQPTPMNGGVILSEVKLVPAAHGVG